MHGHMTYFTVKLITIRYRTARFLCFIVSCSCICFLNCFTPLYLIFYAQRFLVAVGYTSRTMKMHVFPRSVTFETCSITSACQGGDVFACVRLSACLFVCSTVSRITRKNFQTISTNLCKVMDYCYERYIEMDDWQPFWISAIT